MRPANRASNRPGLPAPRSAGWIVGRVALAAIALAGLSFAIQGGEYGTTDLIRQRSELADQRAAVQHAEHRRDSLARYLRAVETDPRTQERVAREEFGMVKPGEILYRFAEQGER